jgi:hypothetical protein
VQQIGLCGAEVFTKPFSTTDHQGERVEIIDFDERVCYTHFFYF